MSENSNTNSKTVDVWGSRCGSFYAKVNALLFASKSGMTMAELVLAVANPKNDTYYDHLGRMIDKGFVEKSDKLFKATAKGREHAAGKQQPATEQSKKSRKAKKASKPKAKRSKLDAKTVAAAKTEAQRLELLAPYLPKKGKKS